MPVDIHGKKYNTVAERLKEADKDLMEVNTEVLFIEPRVVIKATIKTKKGTFTGISAANSSKNIEKESPFEVAETSAVGRALAFAGYATTDAIASYEEMRKAGYDNMDKEVERVVDNFIKDASDPKKVCPKCGAPMTTSKYTNKTYCSKLCWKNQSTPASSA